MFTRRQWIALVVIGATAGALAMSVWLASTVSNDTGDVLGFFGGAIGAGLAVIGALWLEGRKDSHRKEMLANSLLQLAVTANKLDSIEDENIAAGLLTFRQSVLTFEAVRGSVEIDDAVAYFSMSSIIYWASVFDKEAEETMIRLDNGSITPSEAKNHMNPKLEKLASAVGSTLNAHPYWKRARARYSNLLSKGS